jgi:hypothetical protein
LNACTRRLWLASASGGSVVTITSASGAVLVIRLSSAVIRAGAPAVDSSVYMSLVPICSSTICGWWVCSQPITLSWICWIVQPP